MNDYYVYIMASITNSTLYIGVTNSLQRRVAEHKSELIEGFSKRYKTTKLVYYEITQDVNAAIAREKQLKKWSRIKKDTLVETMNPEWKDLALEDFKNE